jgi:hypothetical protein
VNHLKFAGRTTVIAIVALFLSTPFLTSRTPQGNDTSIPPVSSTSGKALHALGSVGGYFTENVGQVNGLVRYYSRGNPSVAFRDDGVMFVVGEAGNGMGKGAWREPTDRPVVDETTTARSFAYMLRFEGANAVTPTAKEQLAFSSNFFIGNDPAEWRTGVRSYREVVYENLYDGVGLVYRTTNQGLKYDFILSPGRNLETIVLSYEGIDGLATDLTGDLLIHTVLGDIIDTAPIAYQGEKQVTCSFTLLTSHSYGMDCQDVDDSIPLIIDPLVYATYLGGGRTEYAYSLDVDPSGNAYVTGYTDSTDFPATPGAFDRTQNGWTDAFVAKLDATGSSLIYATYLGGRWYDYGESIIVDSAGNAYVTGNTSSADFPTTPAAYDRAYNGGGCDAFVVKLGATGSSLVYATYLGGGGQDRGFSMDVDSAGNAYVTGSTESTNFPVTPSAFDKTLDVVVDAFIAKLDAAGGSLIYATYLGGNEEDRGWSIAVDSAGSAYVAGDGRSTDFPFTPGAFDTSANGNADVFVTKLDATGSSLIYSTYIGGWHDDYARSIAVDPVGNAYVTGSTYSDDFPVTSGAFDGTMDGPTDVFVVKLDAAGSSLIYSTYLGGGSHDEGESVFVDSAGDAYVTGGTYSMDFPVTSDALDETQEGENDAFIVKLDATASSLVYATYLGGSWSDFAYSIAVDSFRNAYVTGYTDSTDFPVTTGAFDKIQDGRVDGFVVKLGLGSNNPPMVSGLGVQGFISPPGILHITDFTPDLSWTYFSPDGRPQALYDVRVGSAPGAADIWNPPSTRSAATSVTYAGSPLMRSGDYYFAVRVNDSIEWSVEVEVSFHVNSIPNPPTTPITPPQSSITPPSGSEALTWTAGGDAEGDTVTYDWQVSTDMSFATMVGSGTTTGTMSTSFATSPSTAYYWRVRARDDYEPATWSDYGNSPPGYWTFSTSSPSNTAPIITITSPVGGEVWYQGSSHAVTWTTSDNEDAPSALLVWINYTSSAGSGRICGPVAGNAGSCAWTLPAINATDVIVNATVADTGGLRGYDDSGPFTIQTPPAVNTPPTVSLTSPIGGEHWDKGSTHGVTWSMHDDQDLNSNLTVYLNYTTGGVTTSIVAGLKGIESYQWALPDIVATDVVVNITVIDTGGLKGWAQSGPFEIKIPTSPPSVETNYKPFVAAVFAIILLIAGVWSSKRRPWKGGKDTMAVAKAFTILSMPFVLAEAGTGVVSLLTGQLSIPPLVEAGTVVDLSILIAGLCVVLLRALRTMSPAANGDGDADGR